MEETDKSPVSIGCNGSCTEGGWGRAKPTLGICRETRTVHLFSTQFLLPVDSIYYEVFIAAFIIAIGKN